MNLLEFSKHNLNQFYFILAFQTWFDLSWIFSFVFKLLLLLPMIIFFFFERYTPIRWLRSPLSSCCCGRYYAWYHTTSSCCWGRYYAGYHTTSSFWMILCWISLGFFSCCGQYYAGYHTALSLLLLLFAFIYSSSLFEWYYAAYHSITSSFWIILCWTSLNFFLLLLLFFSRLLLLQHRTPVWCSSLLILLLQFNLIIWSIIDDRCVQNLINTILFLCVQSKRTSN